MSSVSTEPRRGRRAAFAILVALCVFGAAAAAHHGLGHEDPRQNAAEDAAAREALGDE